MADVSDPKINEGALVNPNMRIFLLRNYLSVRGSSLKQIRCQLGPHRLRGSSMFFLFLSKLSVFSLPISLVPRTTALIN